MTAPAESTYVFNIVWTGWVFTYLRYFVASQIHHSQARFRFVANGCRPDQIELMERFATRQPDRVVDVFETSPSMEAHGVALDKVLAARDDGDHFCFIDPDILVKGPFVRDFSVALDDGCAGVSSGRGIWTESDVVPPGHPGVSGESFYSQDGYIFGSPHFAMYRRAPLDESLARWSAGFGSGGPQLPQRTKDRLAAAGHTYWLYDTGKIVNILLQEDGNRFRHFEHPALVHIGGMSHYLYPPEADNAPYDEGAEPDQTWPWPEQRLKVARFTAAVLRELCAGRPAPQMPTGLDASLTERLAVVRAELTELVATYDSYIREATT